MKLRTTLAAVAMFVCIAAQPISPKPTAAEAPFVASVATYLGSHFATAADAERAGYFRYTNEDKTGSISYANDRWTSADAQHPSQLWYDVKGKLLGADYSVPLTDTAPSLWKVQPARWETFHAHVHYVLAAANGHDIYGATSVAKFKAAGGDADKPDAQTLVKLGIAKDAAQVKHVFLFPAVWNLEVWAIPNPNGAFAEMNPRVRPSANAGKGDDS